MGMACRVAGVVAVDGHNGHIYFPADKVSFLAACVAKSCGLLAVYTFLLPIFTYCLFLSCLGQV